MVTKKKTKMCTMRVTPEEKELVLKHRFAFLKTPIKDKVVEHNLNLSICYGEFDSNKKLPDDFEVKSDWYKLTIDYPLNKKYEANIHKCTGHKLIELIQDHYAMVYDNPVELGVYGHDITDLFLGRITINHTKKTITLSVGS